MTLPIPTRSRAAETFAVSRAPRARRRALALAVLATALTGPAVAAQAELAGIDFLPAVQGIGQNARLLLVNLDVFSGRNIPPGPCRVAVQFIDAKGDDVGPAQNLAIGVGRSLAAEAPAFVKTGLPIVLRAHVSVISRPAVPPGPCAGLHGNYEVYDTQTLETKFVSPGAIRGFNPQPDPPGTVGR